MKISPPVVSFFILFVTFAIYFLAGSEIHRFAESAPAPNVFMIGLIAGGLLSSVGIAVFRFLEMRGYGTDKKAISQVFLALILLLFASYLGGLLGLNALTDQMDYFFSGLLCAAATITLFEAFVIWKAADQ